MKRSVTTCVLATALTCLAAPVQAAPIEREHYSGTDAFEFDDCGFVITGVVEFEGVYLLKAPRTPDGPPYFFDNYHAVETLTANGRTLTIEHQGVWKDHSIEPVTATAYPHDYRFVAMESGRPVVLRGEDGRVLLRDRGMLRFGFTVDTKGDTDLENDEHLEGSFEVLTDRGDHPVLHMTEEESCEVFRDYFLG